LLDYITQWLAEHESVLSAIAAIVALLGMAYAMLMFVLSSVSRTADKSLDKRKIQGHSPAPDASAVSRPAPTVTARQHIHDDHVSLAVLRFEPLSNVEEDKYLASGIASEVIAMVAPVPDIRVSSRNTSFGWDTGKAGIEAAGEQLNADFVLSGSLQRAGNRIHVIARLTDVHSFTEVWTQTYDRELEDLFAVQHNIAQSIVGAMLAEVKRAEALLANKMPVHQLDAWGLVQKAYHFWLTTFTVEAIFKAAQYLRRALEIDPDYAAARSALAMLLAQQMTARICEDYDAVAKEAAVMIAEAYRLAPNDIDVLENAGVVWQNLGESERSIRALRHGIELAPLNLISRGYLALVLAFTRGEEGAREAQELIAENFAIAPKHPAAAYWHWFNAVAAQALGRYDESMAHCEKSLQGQPGWIHNYFFMANAYCLKGDVDRAREVLANAAQINPMLTPQLHLENVDRITGSPALSEAFVGGLLDKNLVVRSAGPVAGLAS